jgi:acetylornithine/N-succinyldiaminopimelate aminotransferase
VVLDGNYHGTDMAAQHLRGLWPELVSGLDVITVQPNDPKTLETVFRSEGARIASFWAEPVLMNREAIAVDAGYLHLARSWCDRVGALLCIDEIQTGFWQPEVFAYRALGLRPDLVVVGKGMTAGFHPLAAVLFKQRFDMLAQYDAISTNGSAAMPALVGLGCLELIRQNESHIRTVGQRIETGFRRLAAEFPDRVKSAQGRGYLSGIKFKRVEDAIQFHRRSIESGLWTRVHAYHEGHSTLLTKLGLLAEETIVDAMLEQFRKLLREN